MTTATTDLSRLYTTLSPAERAALHLEAKARGDAAEADRLTRSCPRKRYEEADAAYADRLELAHDKACAVTMILPHYLGKLQTLYAVMNLVGGFAPCFRTAATMAFFDGMRHVDAQRFRESIAERETDKEATAVPAKVQAAMDGVDEATQKLRKLLRTTAETVARDSLEAWTAFGRFRRECVGVEPDVLLAGCGFPDSLGSSIVESLSSYLELTPRQAETNQLAETLSREWRQRFRTA